MTKPYPMDPYLLALAKMSSVVHSEAGSEDCCAQHLRARCPQSDWCFLDTLMKYSFLVYLSRVCSTLVHIRQNMIRNILTLDDIPAGHALIPARFHE